MVLGTEFSFLEFEQRKIRYPERIVTILRNQLEPFSQVEAKTGEHLVHEISRGVGNHDDDVSVVGMKAVFETFLLRFTEELDDVRLQPAIRHLHPGHAPGAEGWGDSHGIFILKHVLAERIGLSFDAKSFDAAAPSNTCLKTAYSVSARMSVTSSKAMPKRRSGRSDP